MRLMLADEPPLDVTDDEEQLRRALMPLVHNRDGHFLATLSALLLSLLEGKTDCPISGVFGAGKTRAASCNYLRADHCRSFPEDYEEKCSVTSFCQNISLDFPFLHGLRKSLVVL